jgi:N-acetylmuramoyl-L-alanine amidase
VNDRFLTDLADVCRRSGYPVIEVEGWQNRARGSGGYDDGRPNHVIAHHTASGPSMDGWGDVNYCTFNHQDAPLCNIYLSRVPEIYVCAGGATNTNGSGHDPCGVTPDDSMNSHAIGIEAGNNGVGELWPEAMQDAYVALCRVLCEGYGFGLERVHAHFEWAPSRKIDPAGQSRYAGGADKWDMNRFRADCGGTPTTPGPTPQPPPSGYVPPPFPGTGDYGCSYNVCRAWQDAMILNGIIADNNSNHDGVWGDGMHNACFNMQRSWGWSDADGIGGQHSWAHLRSRDVAPCPKCGG